MTREADSDRPQSSVVEASRLLISTGYEGSPWLRAESGGSHHSSRYRPGGGGLDIKESIEPYLEKETVVLWSEMPLPVAGAIMEFAAAEACPVIDTNLKLVGIISDRDLIKASVIEESVEKTDMSTDAGEDAWMWDRVMQTINKYYTISRIQLRNILVREAMVPPITAFKKNGISESAALMHKNRIDQMPVITPSQKLMGMLKDSDILKALIDHCEKDAP